VRAEGWALAARAKAPRARGACQTTGEYSDGLLGNCLRNSKTAMVFLGRGVKRADSLCSHDGELMGYV
jgi:hypothetical protein